MESANSKRDARSADIPRRVVAMGGGTGLPVVLRGLRAQLSPSGRSAITAVVTMTDDGGSSGRLRRSLGVPPPGDLRNCLVALSEREDLISVLFQHRYQNGNELCGHNLGNLILAALAEQTGSFLKAVEVSSQVLRTCGRILPATFENVTLTATLTDGSVISGETTIDESDVPIERISLEPAEAAATPGVIEAIEQADLVVLGPGSLYTSILPNLVVAGISEALARTDATVVMVGNLVSEPTTHRAELADHLEIMHEHAGREFVDALLVHEGPADPQVIARYEQEGSRLLRWQGAQPSGVRLVPRSLVASDAKLRHDPEKTAEGILCAWRALSMQPNRSADAQALSQPEQNVQDNDVSARGVHSNGAHSNGATGQEPSGQEPSVQAGPTHSHTTQDDAATQVHAASTQQDETSDRPSAADEQASSVAITEARVR